MLLKRKETTHPPKNQEKPTTCYFPLTVGILRQLKIKQGHWAQEEVLKPLLIWQLAEELHSGRPSIVVDGIRI